jgi:ribonucleoside-triphosphate reductase
MRNLEDIEKDLAEAREALSGAQGTPAEVYSRIVGYYRSVRNWNLGKREEYGERRLYRLDENRSRSAVLSPFSQTDLRILLFVRDSCPGCPPAKAAAGRLGIPVDIVNADTAGGMAEALRRGVMSTPTAILVSPEYEELARAQDAAAIGNLLGRAVRAEPVTA